METEALSAQAKDWELSLTCLRAAGCGEWKRSLSLYTGITFSQSRRPRPGPEQLSQKVGAWKAASHYLF